MSRILRLSLATLVWASIGPTVEADTASRDAPAQQQQGQPTPRPRGALVVPGGGSVDVNRPQTSFDCELPIGQAWYGTRERCLAYLCAGENVYNEYIFDSDGRRRKNPCYGQSATELPPE
ncbi:MAG: hypothetical protein ACHQ9S_27670 [Candidatus Binatia bacterium]